jgi:hypothetical protein
MFLGLVVDSRFVELYSVNAGELPIGNAHSTATTLVCWALTIVLLSWHDCSTCCRKDWEWSQICYISLTMYLNCSQ